MALLAFAALLMCLNAALAYPEGPPPTACGNMYPEGHHYENTSTVVVAYNTTSPYTYRLSSAKYCSGRGIQVTLQTGSDRFAIYEGIFIQARCASGNCTGMAQGKWLVRDSQLTTMNCSGKISSAVSHNSKEKKGEKTITWIPDAGFTDTIVIRGTWVRETDEFWVNVDSQEIQHTTNQDECAVSSAARLTVVLSSFILIAASMLMH